MKKDSKSIVLGGGCFWCLEAAYQQLRGVDQVISGYSGGETPNPSYEAVCSGVTGHVEVVKVVYDQDVISLDTILAVFWTIHDPTTLNRQGADVGSQYASVIFYVDDEQQAAAAASRDEAQQQLARVVLDRHQQLAPRLIGNFIFDHEAFDLPGLQAAHAGFADRDDPGLVLVAHRQVQHQVHVGAQPKLGELAFCGFRGGWGLGSGHFAAIGRSLA